MNRSVQLQPSDKGPPLISTQQRGRGGGGGGGVQTPSRYLESRQPALIAEIFPFLSSLASGGMLGLAVMSKQEVVLANFEQPLQCIGARATIGIHDCSI